MTDLLLLPGDGIGPEVIGEVRRVAAVLTPDLSLDERLFGGCSYDAHGTPLTAEALAAAKAARAVLMGAVGGPQWAGAPRDKRPEAGLLSLRAGMEVADLDESLSLPVWRQSPDRQFTPDEFHPMRFPPERVTGNAAREN